MSVTFILNGFRRSYTLKQQYEAIKAQTNQDFEIILWINNIDSNTTYDKQILDSCHTIISNTNYGVWGRFTAALNARTKYVCVVDDDTIPGKKWLDNCLETVKTHNGILSTRGVIMNAGCDNRYPMPDSYTAVGWCNPNEDVVQVDMGCHSWFFEKTWIRAFFAEMPDVFPMRYGEDMHLSYSVKKHFGINTYVPKHPKNNIDLWGSMPETAVEYGTDSAAVSWSNEANLGMNRYWNFIRQMQYPILKEQNIGDNL